MNKSKAGLCSREDSFTYPENTVSLTQRRQFHLPREDKAELLTESKLEFLSILGRVKSGAPINK